MSNSIDFQTVITKNFQLSNKALEILSPEIKEMFTGANKDNPGLDYNIIIIDKKPKKQKKVKKYKNLPDELLGSLVQKKYKNNNGELMLSSVLYSKDSNIINDLNCSHNLLF